MTLIDGIMTGITTLLIVSVLAMVWALWRHR
jgi:hypothetical protein